MSLINSNIKYLRKQKGLTQDSFANEIGVTRSVIATAYENLAGTNQVHRAILRMLDPTGFEDFLKDLGGEVAQILRVEHHDDGRIADVKVLPTQPHRTSGRPTGTPMPTS